MGKRFGVLDITGDETITSFREKSMDEKVFTVCGFEGTKDYNFYKR